METFAERYTNQIRGVISCFDRVNGHNWLARQLDNKGFDFNLVDNAFIDISDFEQAQHIADTFNVRRLHRILDRYALMCCPVVKRQWSFPAVESCLCHEKRVSLRR